MQCNSRSKAVLALLLLVSLLATGCSAEWIKVALTDLPVLLQMSLNLGTLATTLQSGRQLSPAETLAIENISAEAGRDLNLLKTLYDDYNASPSVDTMQKIQSAIANINQNLAALLQAAHIGDPVLSARITAGVNLILITVNSFASLMPSAGMQVIAQKRAVNGVSVPRAKNLKEQWNHQVCGPSGRIILDALLQSCPIK